MGLRMKFFLGSAILLTAILAGCGDGDSTSPAAPPAAPPTVETQIPAVPSGLAVSYGVKSLAFSWAPVADATSYRLLEDLDGAGPEAAVAVGAPVAAASATYTPPDLLHTRLNAQYRVEACNAVGCSAASLPVTPDLTKAIGYFKASSSGPDGFGRAVALSADGSTLAVGAPYEDSAATGIDGNQADNSASNSGAVYVFVRSTGGAWAQQAYLKASNTGAGDQFGMIVSLSADGGTLAVGAPYERSAATGINGNQADDSSGSAGAVYVFTRTAGTWSQEAYLKSTNADAGDLFGDGLGLSGDGTLLAVGAWGESSSASGVGGNQADNSLVGAGAAYLFRRNAGLWSQEAYLKASNPRQNLFFGKKVAVSSDGGTVAVSGYDTSNATGIDGNQADASLNSAGAVYVFAHAGGAWSQQAYVKASNTDAGDLFGNALALSADGSTMAVAAYGEASAASGVGGNQADNSMPGAGAIYVFTRAGTAWSQQAYLKASNTGQGDGLGWAVALSADGNTLAAGAAFEAGGGAGFTADPADNSINAAGAAYVFTRTGGTWSHSAYLKAPNPSSTAEFGLRLALSGDGSLLAIGGPQDPSAATGIQGDQADASVPGAGAVYLY